MKILLLIALIALSLLLSASLRIPDPYNCVEMTWHRNMICEWPFGHFTNYTAGSGNVVIAGSIIPENAKWDGMWLALSGKLVNNGSCTMLDVKRAIMCIDSPSLSSGTR